MCVQVPDPGREATAVEEDRPDPDPGLQLVQEPQAKGQDAGHARVSNLLSICIKHILFYVYYYNLYNGK